MATSLGRATLINVPNALTTLYTVPASTITSIISLYLSNKTGSTITVRVGIIPSGGSITYVGYDTPIPVGGSLNVINNKPIVITAGDVLQVFCSNGTACDAVASLLVQT